MRTIFLALVLLLGSQKSFAQSQTVYFAEGIHGGGWETEYNIQNPFPAWTQVEIQPFGEKYSQYGTSLWVGPYATQVFRASSFIHGQALGMRFRSIHTNLINVRRRVILNSQLMTEAAAQTPAQTRNIDRCNMPGGVYSYLSIVNPNGFDAPVYLWQDGAFQFFYVAANRRVTISSSDVFTQIYGPSGIVAEKVIYNSSFTAAKTCQILN